MEIWLPVTGFEGIYDVSNLGAVRRIKPYKLGKFVNQPLPRILTGGNNGRGYKTVLLSDSDTRRSKTYKIHQLVANAFLGPRPEKQEINHINRDRSDNRLCNLEYVSHQRNMKHCYEFKERQDTCPRGTKHHNARITEQIARDIKQRLKSGEIMRNMAEQYGVSIAAIHMIKTGKTWARA